GFQWFLSFYLRLNAERDETNIILIDEPGLYLHAKAQGDVLKVLGKISKESQVIFSTHSPYLIDAKRLDRVRLILKDDKNGTRIENKIHKGADIETLTPIITAIGLDISHDFSIAGKRNILLEGISDYYFLQALKKYTKTDEVNLIPCVGAQKIPQLVSLLIGWNLEFLAVLDNDNKGKRIAKELAEKLAVENKKIIFVSDQDGYSIEDLFTHEDFNNFVLNETKNVDKSVPNSKFLKDKKLDKVLLAKKFFESVESGKSKIKLSQETINAFKQLFEKVASGFK
ncbi:AAA family ATPase, partial [candidate division NPL-UPA2 bacterium]|nr:AAA family ATPase [candidate division NPL-UPA2 bacterium]